MTKQTKFQVGTSKPMATGTPLEGKRWLLRMKNHVTLKDVRKVVQGSKAEAMKEAATFYSENTVEPAYVPTIRDGLLQAIKLSGMNEKSRKDTRLWANRFMEWLDSNHPRVKTWEEMRRSVLDHYVRFLEERRTGPEEDRPLAYDTVRLAVRPILAAWKRAHLDYPEEVFPPSSPKISARKKSRPDCLQPSEVREMLDYFERSGSPLFPVVVLQSLAGLRMLEAAAVRVSDIDFERGFLSVVSTPLHTLKNEGSERTIPLCREALDRLRSWIVSQAVAPITGEVSVSRSGKPWTLHSLRSEWVKMIGKAETESEKRKAQGENPLRPFGRLQPKRLRSAFATMAGRLGISDRALKRYLGQAAGDVLGTHYRVILDEELRSVSDRMNAWRDLPDVGETWQKRGSSKEKSAI